MKKIILTLIATALTAGFAFAQDMGLATETAKTANEALTTQDYGTALKGFKEALKLAEACGDEGAELVATCKDIIPRIMLTTAKDQLKAGNLDESLAGLAEAVAAAKEYGVIEVEDEAAELVPQIKLKKANNLYKAQDFVAAAEAFKAILDENPTDGKVALNLGACLNKTGDVEGAIAAFTTALENGQVVNAKKQLSTIYLKQASTALKAKKYADAIEAAAKSNEYVEDAKTTLIMGQAAQGAGKDAEAIKYFEKYLEQAPTAKNAGQINVVVGGLYQKAGNKAKAKEFYQKSLEAGYADAQKFLDALAKAN